MGYPVGKQSADSCNIVNADRLRGKLMVSVGEMDTNVPPESTMRLADALIKAGKDFDLVVVPGMGHGSGGADGDRRAQGFFAPHPLRGRPARRQRGAGRGGRRTRAPRPGSHRRRTRWAWPAQS